MQISNSNLFSMTTNTSTTKYIPRCIAQQDMINMREQTRILNEWDWNRTPEMLTSFMEGQPNGPFLLYAGTKAQRHTSTQAPKNTCTQTHKHLQHPKHNKNKSYINQSYCKTNGDQSRQFILSFFK